MTIRFVIPPGMVQQVIDFFGGIPDCIEVQSGVVVLASETCPAPVLSGLTYAAISVDEWPPAPKQRRKAQWKAEVTRNRRRVR